MSDDALTGRQAREHIEDIASALRTINGRAEELVEAIEERDETIARLTAELAEARAALRDAAHIVEGVRAAARGVGVDFSRRMMPNELAALLRWRAGDHATVVEAAR